MALTDKLTAIADAIRLKRDLTTDMTLDEMPLQIALIDGGGGGGIEMQSGTFTPPVTSNYKYETSIPITDFTKLYRTNALFYMWCTDPVTDSATLYYLLTFGAIFTPETRTLEKSGNYWVSTAQIQVSTPSGTKTPNVNQVGVSRLSIRGSTAAFTPDGAGTFNQTSKGITLSVSNQNYAWLNKPYKWVYVYFGDDPVNDIINL